MAGTYVNICDPTGPNKEVVYDYPTGVGSGKNDIEARKVVMTPNSANGTVTCKTVKCQVLVCALLLILCLLILALVTILFIKFIGINVAVPVCITLIVIGVMVLPIVFMVHSIRLSTRITKKPTDPEMADIIYVNVGGPKESGKKVE